MIKQVEGMPEDCRKLYLKFVRLRHQTRNLKQNLGKIKENEDKKKNIKLMEKD